MNTKSFPFVSLLLYVFTCHLASAQAPQVPRQIQFADITISLNEQARREIQLDVDALYRNPTYFKIKAERVNLYLPIVERELRDAGVPTDLKYLVIQESSLISDAVSTSNAVGFWQFKKGTAEEVHLRVDNQIDDRKNIVSSTRGAALYLKKHNSQFDNWMCALVSYQMGLGGAKAYFGAEYNGKNFVELNRNSHWYFKKFLAHKIAFEGPTATLVNNNEYLEEIKVQGPTTLKQLAKKLEVTEAHLKEYNKWTGNGSIPSDKTYTVVYIRTGSIPSRPALATNDRQSNQNTQNQTVAYSATSSYPRVTGDQSKATQPDQIQINNIDGVKAPVTTTQDNFTDRIGIRERKFRRINDLDKGEKVEEGQYYYTKPKKSKAEVGQHITQPGETLWGISQMYGIKLASLKAKNRIFKDQDLKAGMVLSLREHRKRGEDIRIVPVKNVPKTVLTNTTTKPAPEVHPVSVSTPPNPVVENSNNGSERVIHTVLQGDNLFRISQTYNVSVDNIRMWNNLPDNNIKIGQKITIYKP